jgi:predicted DNA-binding transcriptional regulator YafY
MQFLVRPPMARMLAIHRALKAGEYPNARTLARRLEVTPRTIQRDITYLGDQLQAPIRYDASRRGYAYTEPSFELPFHTWTESELVALFLAERVLQQYRNTPYAAELARAFAKLTDGLSDRITLDLRHLGALPSFHVTAPAEFAPEVFRDEARL